MPTCKDIDVHMMDWLYGELEPSVAESFREHVGSCDACRAEFESFTRIRALLRELPALTPPQAVTNIVLHEAGKRAQVSPVRGGLWSWLAGLVQPLVAHPAAAALASLVLVATVGGTLYIKRGAQVAEPTIAPSASEMAPARQPTVDSTVERPGVAATTPAQPDPYAAPDVGDAPADERTESLTAATGESLKRQDRGYKADIADEKEQTALRKVAAKSGKSAVSELQGDLLYNAVSGADSPDDDADYRQTAGEGRGGRRNTDGSVAGGAGASLDEAASAIDATKAQRPFAEPVPQAPPLQTSSPPPESKPGPAGTSKDKATWAESEHSKLLAALRESRCSDAARIANDIKDRDRAYYDANVGSSKAMAPCRAQVVAEGERRAARRTKKAKAAEKQADQAQSLE